MFNGKIFEVYIYPIILCVITFIFSSIVSYIFRKKDKLPVLHMLVYILNKNELLKDKKIYKFDLKTTKDISSEEENIEKNRYILKFKKIDIKDIKQNMYAFYFEKIDKIGFLFSHIEYTEYGKFNVDDKLIDLSRILEDEDIIICDKESMPRYFYCNINNRMYKYEILGENQRNFYAKKCKIK